MSLSVAEAGIAAPVLDVDLANGKKRQQEARVSERKAERAKIVALRRAEKAKEVEAKRAGRARLAAARRAEKKARKGKTEPAAKPKPAAVSGSTLCVICLDAPRTHLADPCGHQAYCGPCSEDLDECAICRQKVNKFIRVFSP